jgi:hypothetical protein
MCVECAENRAKKFAENLPYRIFATRFKKKHSSSQNKLIFTPNTSNKIEKKFGRNIQALTFALPFKKWVAVRSQKIFESWETIALYLNSH